MTKKKVRNVISSVDRQLLLKELQKLGPSAVAAHYNEELAEIISKQTGMSYTKANVNHALKILGWSTKWQSLRSAARSVASPGLSSGLKSQLDRVEQKLDQLLALLG